MIGMGFFGILSNRNKVQMNPNAHLITGSICGYRVEEITNPLTQKVRYLDKLVDDLAKGYRLDRYGLM